MDNEAQVKRHIRKLNDKIHLRTFMDMDKFEKSVDDEIPNGLMYEWNGNLVPIKPLYILHASFLIEQGTKNLYDYFLTVIYPD